jgi:hypothetical protein
MNGTNGWTGCAETEPHRSSQTTAATLWYFMGNPISPGHLLQRFGPSAEASRDVLALKLAQYGCFYSGESKRMRDVLALVLPAWDAAMPGYGFVLGCHAFGLATMPRQSAPAAKLSSAIRPISGPRTRWRMSSK